MEETCVFKRESETAFCQLVDRNIVYFASWLLIEISLSSCPRTALTLKKNRGYLSTIYVPRTVLYIIYLNFTTTLRNRYRILILQEKKQTQAKSSCQTYRKLISDFELQSTFGKNKVLTSSVPPATLGCRFLEYHDNFTLLCILTASKQYFSALQFLVFYD